jgi:16S rRNA (adenine1518-N6/adenine1519-N6)-dimethyltransferase
VSSELVGEVAVRRALEAAGVRPSKRLGQNFLVDPRTAMDVVDIVRGETPRGVVEIGAGLGALTLPLAAHVERLVALEIDRRLAKRMQELLASRADSVEILQQDVLEYDFDAAAAAWGERLTVVGSIPYSITAPILKKLIDARAAIRSAYLITQREVAEKILASPSRDGTALGIFVQAYADASVLRKIPRGAFFPVPDVESYLWKLTMREEPRFTSSEESFFAVVRAIYGARRKTLRNALQRAFSAAGVDALLASSGIDGKVRGETLGFSELDALANAAQPLLREGTGGMGHGESDEPSGKGLS